MREKQISNFEEHVNKYSNFISQYTFDQIIDWCISEKYAAFINALVLLLLLAVIVYLVHLVSFKALRFFFQKITNRNKNGFLRRLMKYKISNYISMVIPLFIIYESLPIVFEHYPSLLKFMLAIHDILIILLFIAILMTIIRSVADALKENTSFAKRPIESYIQVVRIIVYFIAAILLFSKFTGKDVKAFFGVLGATSAILLLMFKDTIMGFVASIQVTTNDMVRIGDWITMPSFGADGDVLEITLTTVKVQNFDKTVTTIPTHNLITSSFQNWRGMQEFGERIRKRLVYNKKKSNRYIQDDELENFMKSQAIKDYIKERKKEIDNHNKKLNIDKSIAINGRNFTNSGLFRKYAQWYIENHPGVDKNKTIMLRQLQPTEHGIPFEVYLFANTVNWLPYETIMGDIFDHLIAAIPYFDLEVYELPTGSDISKSFKKEGFEDLDINDLNSNK